MNLHVHAGSVCYLRKVFHSVLKQMQLPYAKPGANADAQKTIQCQHNLLLSC